MTDFFRRTGLLPGTAYVVASNASAATIRQARILKARYGALIQICDSVADHLEIQAALDALSATGGKVQLSEGNFTGGKIRIVKNNVTLAGCGINTCYTLANGTNDNIIEAGDGANIYAQILIETLCLDGNGTNQIATSNGIYFNTRIRQSWINKVLIRNTRDAGILMFNTGYPDGNYHNRITECILNAIGGIGIDINDSSNDCQIATSYINSKAQGIRIGSAFAQINTVNIIREQVGTTGAAIEISGAADGIMLTGVFIEYGTGKGLQISTADHINIVGVHITTCGGDAIETFSNHGHIQVVIEKPGTDGVIVRGNYNTIDVVIDQAGQDGVHLWGNTSCNRITGVISQSSRYGIYDQGDRNIVVGMNIRNCGSTGWVSDSDVNRAIIDGNIFYENGQGGGGAGRAQIQLNRCYYCVVTNNVVFGSIAQYGIWEESGVGNLKNLIVDNIIQHANTKLLIGGTDTKYADNYAELFMDVLAESVNHVVNAENLNVAPPITCTIAAQPDVPRNIKIAITDADTSITAFQITVSGKDAKGNSVSEQFTQAGGLTQVGSIAFATISSVIVNSITGAGDGDVLNVGIGSKLGLSNAICFTADVYKVKKNNAHYSSASYTTNATYGTVDVSTGAAITGGDDFTIWYRMSRNTMI